MTLKRSSYVGNENNAFLHVLINEEIALNDK